MLDRSDLLHFTLRTVLHNLTEGMILVTVVLFLFLLNVRAAFIVALTIPFSLLFASIWLNGTHIPANLLSLGALDFGMVVDGAVVMVENIMRHLSRGRQVTLNGQQQSTGEIIRDACHEVQRPVFYAILIIITAYMPIFTLQRVEGRLFRPMAWTVAFALLGAMTFSILIAPVLSGALFRQGVRESRNPVFGIYHGKISPAAALGRPESMDHDRRCHHCPGCHRLSGFQRDHRCGVPAAPGRRRDLGARHAGQTAQVFRKERTSPPKSAMSSHPFPK